MAKTRRAKTRRSTSETEAEDLGIELYELTRRQLARRLHNGAIQSVAALAMRADLANRLAAKDPAAAVDEVRQLEELARRTTKELRALQFVLRPVSLETLGLEAALHDLVHQENEIYGHAIQLEIKPNTASGLGLRQATLVFHIAAEAVANARRHAQARTTIVKLTRPELHVLLLEVTDDGAGFDWTSLES